MKSFYKFLLISVLMAAGNLFCGGDQQAEAERLALEGNQILAEVRNLAEKTERRNLALFDKKIQTVRELNDYRTEKRIEAQSIVSDYQKVAVLLKTVSAKFEESARLNVGDHYKEYARTKAEEFARRSEAFEVRKGNALAFIELDAPKMMNDKFDENNGNFEKLLREAEELAARTKEMEVERKGLLKELM